MDDGKEGCQGNSELNGETPHEGCSKMASSAIFRNLLCPTFAPLCLSRFLFQPAYTLTSTSVADTLFSPYTLDNLYSALQPRNLKERISLLTCIHANAKPVDFHRRWNEPGNSRGIIKGYPVLFIPRNRREWLSLRQSNRFDDEIYQVFVGWKRRGAGFGGGWKLFEGRG